MSSDETLIDGILETFSASSEIPNNLTEAKRLLDEIKQDIIQLEINAEERGRLRLAEKLLRSIDGIKTAPQAIKRIRAVLRQEIKP